MEKHCGTPPSLLKDLHEQYVEMSRETNGNVEIDDFISTTMQMTRELLVDSGYFSLEIYCRAFEQRQTRTDGLCAHESMHFAEQRHATIEQLKREGLSEDQILAYLLSMQFNSLKYRGESDGQQMSFWKKLAAEIDEIKSSFDTKTPQYMAFDQLSSKLWGIERGYDSKHMLLPDELWLSNYDFECFPHIPLLAFSSFSRIPHYYILSASNHKVHQSVQNGSAIEFDFDESVSGEHARIDFLKNALSLSNMNSVLVNRNARHFVHLVPRLTTTKLLE